MTPEMAEFLGLMVADGCVPAGHQHVDFANNDEWLRLRITQLWSKVFMGRVKASTSAVRLEPGGDRRAPAS